MGGGLGREEAVLLGEVARRGLHGKLDALRKATTWPSPGCDGPVFDDPPGLGGL